MAITRDGSSINIAIETVDASGTTHRRVIEPGAVVSGAWVATDVSQETADVQALAAELWTPDAVAPVKSMYIAMFTPPPPTQADYAAAVQMVVDQTAQARQYANGDSLAGYKNSTITQWSNEAAAFISWRDQVWQYAFNQFAGVQAGTISPAPTIPQLVSKLPQITWPT